jgi:hypothetical protein
VVLRTDSDSIEFLLHRYDVDDEVEVIAHAVEVKVATSLDWVRFVPLGVVALSFDLSCDGPLPMRGTWLWPIKS